MPPVGTQQGLSDAEIAAVASYVRSAWGNQAAAVTEAIVRQQR
jgi:mono/diheme cytochrome c family protein